MITLAIDSTASTASCALMKDGQLLALSTVCGTLTHSETLLPMIEKMLIHTDLTAAEIDRYAVSRGPGSFTGVRIGVAMVKGLAFGSKKPCIGVSSLAALAHNLDGFDGLIVPVMDARRSQVYTALFCHENGECRRLTGDELIPLSELETKIQSVLDGKPELPIYFVGDGYGLAHRFFDGKLQNLRITPSVLIPHSAFSVALEADIVATEETDFSDSMLSPLYLRASQAEREREEKLHTRKDSKDDENH